VFIIALVQEGIKFKSIFKIVLSKMWLYFLHTRCKAYQSVPDSTVGNWGSSKVWNVIVDLSQSLHQACQLCLTEFCCMALILEGMNLCGHHIKV